MSERTFEIASIERAEVTTKYGVKGQWKLKTSSGNMGTSFIGKWNSNWKAGMNVKAKVEEVKGDKGTFYNFKCPDELRPSQYGGERESGVMKSILEMQSLIANLENRVKALENAGEKEVKEEEPPLPPEPEWFTPEGMEEPSF